MKAKRTKKPIITNNQQPTTNNQQPTTIIIHNSALNLSRRRIKIEGAIRGAGFRPFVCRLAQSLGIAGFVKDEDGVVVIEAEGQHLSKFQKLLLEAPPPSVVIERITDEIIPVLGDTIFRITGTDLLSNIRPLIQPDSALCDNCLNELFNPAERRYHYPFINCPNCGPKFTVTLDLPYDRINTSFAGFKICKRCRNEFNDPLNRQFHNHIISCPDCGPKIWLSAVDESALDTNQPENLPAAEEIIASAKASLLSGQILAVKGIYGFQLICDATDEKAVSILLDSRINVLFPFLIMAPDADSLLEYSSASSHEIELLSGNSRPAVPIMVKTRGSKLAPALLKRHSELCVVLPNSPLDYLLIEGMPPLLLTSGLNADEPLLKSSAEAAKKFRGVANKFLLHNLPLNLTVDVTQAHSLNRKPYYLRRSRGSAPFFINLNAEFPRSILALGGDMNNAYCLARNNEVIISHHTGNLQYYSSFRAFEESIFHFFNIYRFTPELIVCDLHPEYISSAWAELQRLPLKRIQHHQAHIASCLAENNHFGRALGIALDGGGYGTDGALWGGEFLFGSIQSGFKKVGFIKNFTIPGGDIATKEPWRTAVAMLRSVYGDEWRRFAPEKFLKGLDAEKLDAVEAMLRADFNCRRTSACGRLFDAAASISLLKTDSDYPSQPAVEFEALLGKKYLRKNPDDLNDPPYEFNIEGSDMVVLDLFGIVASVAKDMRNGVSPAEISRRFHVSLSAAMAQTAAHLAARLKFDTVALSGGTFQNLHLLIWLKRLLENQGLTVLIHRTLAPGDEGLCLGQAVLAAM